MAHFMYGWYPELRFSAHKAKVPVSKSPWSSYRRHLDKLPRKDMNCRIDVLRTMRKSKRSGSCSVVAKLNMKKSARHLVQHLRLTFRSIGSLDFCNGT